MGEEDEDSVKLILLKRTNSIQLWSSIENWISDLGFPNGILTDDTTILGYHEKPLGINSIILIAKKIIYNAKNTIYSSS